MTLLVNLPIYARFSYKRVAKQHDLRAKCIVSHPVCDNLKWHRTAFLLNFMVLICFCVYNVHFSHLKIFMELGKKWSYHIVFKSRPVTRHHLIWALNVMGSSDSILRCNINILNP